MAWIRQLASGLWAATVHTPAGRITDTDPLKTVVTKWAGDLEADIRRGDFLDPRKAKTTVGAVWEKYGHTRDLELASRKRDESQWRTHVAPRWGSVSVGAILKPDVSGWVQSMVADGVGGWTITGSLNVLKAVLELAVDAGMIRANPARRVKPPVPPDHDDRVLDHEERAVILARLDELFPGRGDARPFVETLMETGSRWEEGAAIRKEAVDLAKGIIRLGPVMERDGTIREYPKGARDRLAAGFRAAAIGPELAGRLRPLVLAAQPGGVVFTAPMGGHLGYSTWRSRVWVPTMRVPVVDGAGRKVKGEWTPLVALPLPTPHDCRHSFGTELAEAGLERHDLMAAMGHKDHRSVARYVHSDEEKRLARIRAARSRRLA
jgi:integrase